MKKMKKLASILLAAIMVLAMAVPAMATDAAGTKGNIQVTGMSDKALEAYQIFSGTQAEGSDVLGDIVWGTGIDGTNFLSALATAGILEGISAESSAEDVAKALVGKDQVTLQKFAELAMNHVTENKTNLVDGENEVDSGYYLVLDKTSGAPVVNVALLQVTNGTDMDVKMKTDIPKVDKEVLDETTDADGTSTDIPNIAPNVDGWGETADHQIGEIFQFKLTAEIPADVNVDIYKQYAVTFHDAISKGITYVGNLHVYVSNETIKTEKEVDAEKYDVMEWFGGEKTVGPQNGSLKISDVAGLGIDTDQTIYITVIYDAKLNSDAVVSTPTNGKLNNGENNNDVYLEYSNNPSSEGTGETTTDDVYVFTYQIPGKKTDGEDKLLQGAKFALYRDAGEGKIEYAIMNDGKLTGWTESVGKDEAVPGNATQVESDVDGLFSFAGFDLGTYYLKETVTPPGYNTALDTEVTIEATHVEVTDGATTTETVNKATEIVVVNKKGTTLPETGGIGTTIFYVLGSILVLGAVILLVTKRRMSVEK